MGWHRLWHGWSDLAAVAAAAEERKGLRKYLKRIIAEKVLNLGKKETVTKVQEIRVPYGINPKRKRQRYTVIKMTKTKDEERILTAAMEKQQIIYKWTSIWLSVYFSAETLQARRAWHDIFKGIKRKNLQLRKLYSARLLFRYDEEMKSFTDKQKLTEFSITKPAFQQMLKILLWAKKKKSLGKATIK